MKKASATAIAIPEIAARTPNPAFAPVLSPLAADGFGVDKPVAAPVSAADDDEDKADWGPLGTAENCSGGAAWKVSDVGVPVHPPSPQQCQSCEV